MQTLNFTNDPKSAIKQTAKVLKNGGLIVFPTDTIYGLGVNATDQQAVNKLLEFKGNRQHKAVSIAVKNIEMASQYAEINYIAHNLYNQYLPGPFTIISKLKHPQHQVLKVSTKKHQVLAPKHPPTPGVESLHKKTPGVDARDSRPETPIPQLSRGLASTENTIGIRIIPHPFLEEIFKHITFPITATSANISGGANNSSIKDFLKRTPKSKLQLIDLIVDAGTLPKRKPSTVIDTTKEDTPILRHGPIELSSQEPTVSSQESVVSNQHTSTSETQTKAIAKKLINSLLRPTNPQHQVLKVSTKKHRVLSVPKHPATPSVDSSHETIKQSNNKLELPTTILLQGQLGAGKTVFTKGIAQTLGITEPLRSPTYTLLKEYSIPKHSPTPGVDSSHEAIKQFSHDFDSPKATSYSKLIHIDAWRLSSEEEFQDLNLDQYLKPSSLPDLSSYQLPATSYPIIIIEWPQRLTQIIKDLQTKSHLILVNIKIINESTREISIRGMRNKK